MGGRDDLPRLMKEANALLKSDARRAASTFETAFGIALAADAIDDAAYVAEHAARAFQRCKMPSRSLHYARISAKLAPGERSGWTTLGNVCELVASKSDAVRKARRAKRLYDAAAEAFAKAAALTTDREDRQWLVELSNDAARAAKSVG